MYLNYFRIAFRNLLKQKIYSGINIFGLALGFSCVIFIMMHVFDEYSYDDFHEKADRIFKVVLERKYPDHITNYAIIPNSYADVMAADYPEVVRSVRVFGNPNNETIVSYIDKQGEKKIFEEKDFIAADSNFFEMFTIPLTVGDPESALSGAQSLVITEETAFKYFGSEEPIGKTLITDFGEFTVKGVCENIPSNSHFDFDFLVSMRSIPFIFQQVNFTGFSTHTYLELTSDTDPLTLEQKFPAMVDKYAAPQIEQNLNISYEEYVKAGNGYNYMLLPLKDIYLDPTQYEGEFKPGGNRNDVFIFISIAFLVLIIACINFMNLSIARSTERAKEVGIRKTLGSLKKQLVVQFLIESSILSILALCISLFMVVILMPEFNQLIEKQLDITTRHLFAVPFLILFAIFIGILAGAWPAFVLSGFNIIKVLKGTMKKGKEGTWLRSGLVSVQFIISIILIFGVIIIYNQMDYVQNKDLGFDRSDVLIIERAGVLENKLETFIDELANMPEVKKTGSSNLVLAGEYFGIQFMPSGASEPITANGMSINDDLINCLDLQIIRGRGFSEEYNDSLSIIINEQTAKLLGLEDPIGAKMSNTDGTPPVIREFEIVGVVKDFHYMSLKNEISPFVLLNFESGLGGPGNIFLKTNGPAIATIEKVESKWKEIVPEEPFKYTFLDDELNIMYKSDMNSGRKLTVFSVLAILIACIGLFGLSAYTTSLRTKEIGVRKVMGASVVGIVLLLSKGFLKTILVSFLIAAPIAWWAMSSWLEMFSYRIDINPVYLFTSGALTLIVSWVTISFQSIKAAIVNPVNSLKDE